MFISKDTKPLHRTHQLHIRLLQWAVLLAAGMASYGRHYIPCQIISCLHTSKVGSLTQQNLVALHLMLQDWLRSTGELCTCSVAG